MPDNFLDYITLGMGNARSKPKGRFGRAKKDSWNYSNGERDSKTSGHGSKDFSAEINQRFAEDEELHILRNTIQCEPELFILNNLLMSVQFFENYDEEITNIRQSLVSREAEINNRLPPQKYALIPDVIQEHVAQKVEFTCNHPELGLTIELLHPIRIYVAFDNIEITEKNFASPYWNPNEQITYSMQLKPRPNHKGYVLLRRLEENPSKKTKSLENLDSASNSTRDEIYSDGDSLYGVKSIASESGTIPRSEKNLDSNEEQQQRIYDMEYGSTRVNAVLDYPSTSGAKDDGIYGIASTSKSMEPHRSGRKNLNGQYGKPRLLASGNGSLAGSTSSGYRSGGNWSDSETYSRTIYNSSRKTSKSSSMGSGGSIISGSEIPLRCFRKIEYEGDGKIYVPRKENRKLNSRDQQLRKAYRSKNYTLSYLNGIKFMKYFCRLFTDQLAVPMGFDPSIPNDVQGGIICRTKWEIPEGTRITKIDQYEIVPSVGSHIWPEFAEEWLDRPRATWPSYKVIEKVKQLGCHMIPKGIISDKSDRLDDLEWQLVFPGGERYLETCLTSPQVKVYLIALMLQKSFMRPGESIVGLTVTDIKHSLFWLVEDDARPSTWMEHRTGESLIKLLYYIFDSIKQDTPNLPDYFLRDKNLFQDRKGLHFIHKQLKRILDNPVMYIFYAMENIRHSRKFFPRLNFEELYRILTCDDVTLTNPALAQYLAIRSLPKTNGNGDDNNEHVGIWEKNYQKDSEQKIYARKKVQPKRNLVNTGKASDDVFEISVRCETMDPRRVSILVDFFIRHFIKMAESCHNYRALAQKVAYVNQAERLSVLLSVYETHKDIAQTYLEKLSSLKRRAATPSRSQNAPTTPPPNPPETPKRNADKAIFVSPLNNRYETLPVIAVNGEKHKEYDSESARSSVYTLQPPPKPRQNQLATVHIHQQDTEKFKLENSNKLTPAMTDDEIKSSSKKNLTVSIVDTRDESYLSETKL